MVIHHQRQPSARAFLMVEMMGAIAILTIVFIPLAYSVHEDAGQFKTTYQRAVAMEIVDGEMEILAAGGWRAFPEGTQVYPVSAHAAQNLPPGQFLLTRNGHHLRLEWTAPKGKGYGQIVREVTVP